MRTRMRLSARHPGPLRQRLFRDEHGQGVVEFAIILPVLLLLLVGIIEFGIVFSNIISMRQGIREAGRQGSVANFPTANFPCPLDLDPPGPQPSDNMKKLMCFAKNQAGVGDSVRVRVKFANKDLTMPAGAGANYFDRNAIVVCAIYPLSSLSGLFQPFLDGRYARTKAAFRIETTGTTDNAAENAGNPVDGWGEKDPSGKNWDWCVTGS